MSFEARYFERTAQGEQSPKPAEPQEVQAIRTQVSKCIEAVRTCLETMQPADGSRHVPAWQNLRQEPTSLQYRLRVAVPARLRTVVDRVGAWMGRVCLFARTVYALAPVTWMAAGATVAARANGGSRMRMPRAGQMACRRRTGWGMTIPIRRTAPYGRCCGPSSGR